MFFPAPPYAGRAWAISALCYRLSLAGVSLPTVTCQTITGPPCLSRYPHAPSSPTSVIPSTRSFVAVSLAAHGSIARLAWLGGRLILALGDAPSVLRLLPSNRHDLAGLESNAFCLCVALIFVFVPALHARTSGGAVSTEAEPSLRSRLHKDRRRRRILILFLDLSLLAAGRLGSKALFFSFYTL